MASHRRSADTASPQPWADFQTAVTAQTHELPALAERLRSQLADQRWSLPVRRVVAIGIGASHGALHAFSRRLEGHGVPVSIRTGADGPGPIDPDAWYVGVSQSGRSAEVVAALEAAPAGRRLAVVNRCESPIGAIADAVLDLGGLADSRVSTIGLTGTVVALTALADRLAGEAADSSALPDLEAWTQPCRAWAADVVPLLRTARATDIIGTGLSQGIVTAGALLLREGAHLPVAGYDTRSYLHGYMDSATAQTAHLVLDGGSEDLLLHQLKEAGARVIRIDGPPGPDRHHLPIPARDSTGRTVAIAYALQHLVLEHARATGERPEDSVFERMDTKVPARALGHESTGVSK